MNEININENIVVSVLCYTYNHERYIRQCLDSIILQKTDFRFEVIVHDDASKDGTREIISEYSEKYPDLIVPVLEKKNLWNKKDKKEYYFNTFGKIRGEFTSICEGDDYWIDEYKLQRQYNELRKHNNVDICAHAVATISDINGEKIGVIAPRKKKCIISPVSTIMGGGGFIGTSSLMYRSKINEKCILYDCSYDYFIQFYGSFRGGIIYLPEEMSAYRKFVSGSMTSELRKDYSKRIEYATDEMLALQRLIRNVDDYRIRLALGFVIIKAKIKVCCFGVLRHYRERK